jgi:site-specific DNA recombinase
MIAAIYARKSTEQNGVAENAKSVTRQVENARAYAVAQGWTVDGRFVFVDDGISGAEFERRPAFMQMKRLLKPKPPFQILIVSEQKSLGRETSETGYLIKELALAGVEIFEYMHGRSLTPKSAIDKFVGNAQAFSDEAHQVATSERVHEAHTRLARAGHVVGGRVFGYANIDIFSGTDVHGRPLRSHVERRIHEPEAVVVRRIFELAASGRGVRAIAKALNADGAPCPQSQRNRPRGWAPSSVRCVLYRDLYRGELVWNKTRKRDLVWRQKRPTRRPEREWLRQAVPALRIVPESLWVAAHARLDDSRGAYLRGTDGRVWGRPLSGVDSKYLLPGLATCACCGGGLIVRSRAHGRSRAYFYACSSYHLRGRSVCTNNLEIPMERLNAAVLEAVGTQVLTADLFEDVIDAAISKLAPAVALLDSERVALEASVERLTAEGDRLTRAIATGGSLAPLVSALAENQAQLEACQRKLLTAGRQAQSSLADEASLRSRLAAVLADWRGLLQRQIPLARQILKKLLVGSVRCLPSGEGDGRYYAFSTEATATKILAAVSHPIMVASPTGFEPVFWP